MNNISKNVLDVVELIDKKEDRTITIEEVSSSLEISISDAEKALDEASEFAVEKVNSNTYIR